MEEHLEGRAQLFIFKERKLHTWSIAWRRSRLGSWAAGRRHEFSQAVKSPKKQIFLAPDLFKFASSSLYCTLYLWRPFFFPPLFSSFPARLPPCVSLFGRQDMKGSGCCDASQSSTKCPKWQLINQMRKPSASYGLLWAGWPCQIRQAKQARACSGFRWEMQMLPERPRAGSKGGTAQAVDWKYPRGAAWCWGEPGSCTTAWGPALQWSHLQVGHCKREKLKAGGCHLQ